jgi:hypothetical protein
MSEETTPEVVESHELPVADFTTILGLPANEFKWVEVPEWNARVKIKALNKAEQIRLRKRSTTGGQIDDIKLEMNLLVDSLVEPKLSFAQVDELYGKASAKALNRIAAAALAFSGLTEDYIEQAEADMKS